MPLSTPSLAAALARNARVHQNLSAAQLAELAVTRGEATLTAQGALTARTGKYTGRSPRDKFVVADPSVERHIDWGPVNQPMAPDLFDRLYHRVLEHLDAKELFVFDGYAGADPDYRLPIRVVTEFAWHNLFVRQLFIRPEPADRHSHQPAWTVLCLPSFQADPVRDGTNSEAFVILNLTRQLVLIGGTHYAGEMKKSVFTVMNYLLPFRDVVPMHCAANVGEHGDVALFFGLSGTGKTTLSADPGRRLIGDDEHGWSSTGVFNFEGGCYAKCIDLAAEQEPQIYGAVRFGTVLENVVVDPATREPDYGSSALTENTRAAYPMEYIPNAVIPGRAGHPRVVIFLTADASGVLPPIARLTREQAMYHFMSGYTSKLAGTERGVTAPEATFSPCFGGPFLPLPAATYAEMLGRRIAEHDVRVYLVNTGWWGGPYGTGQRVSLTHTRAMVAAALSGELEQRAFVPDPVFRVMVPLDCPDVPAQLLQPRLTWADTGAYDQQARTLAQLFAQNFKRFPHVPEAIATAGPRV
ncbi:MAG: ATP-dependent phosphoenolpyruvate carboxykinase [Firmicutes bacterium]|nr:ATP-dependent phosphoenolpyruvate carboxykinase [Bacillota bacterium]